MKLSACLFYLPQSYDDGRLVEPEVILEIIRELDHRFGRCTIESTVEGVWQGKHELMRPVRIAIKANLVSKLRKMVVEIGRRLGHEAMYFEVCPAVVELVPVTASMDRKPTKD